MKIRSSKYFTREACRNVFSNGWMSVASVLTVIASLLVFGLFMIISFNLTYIASQIESDYELLVYLKDGTPSDQVTRIGEQLKGLPNVSAAELSTNNDRLTELQAEFGNDGALLDGYFENNPLRDMYRVTMTELVESDDTAREIEAIAGVDTVVRNSDTIHAILSVTATVRHISLWVMLALAVISVFIISNTIKLTVFARRREINIMKYVGATDWFIRWPFIIEGVIIGFLGCILSLVLLGAGYWALLRAVETLHIEFLELEPFHSIFLPSVGIFAGLGILLGGVGSLVSVRKYLKV